MPGNAGGGLIDCGSVRLDGAAADADTEVRLGGPITVDGLVRAVASSLTECPG